MVAGLDNGSILTFQTPTPLALETVRQKIQDLPDGKYKDAVVLAVGSELEKTSFTAQVFKPTEAEAVAAIGKLFNCPKPPVAKKAAELERGYSNALIQPVEFIGQLNKNTRYNIEVLSPDSEIVKAGLYDVFKTYLVKADSTEATVKSEVLTTDQVLQIPGAAAKNDKGQVTKRINDDFLKYVGALRAEIDLTGQGATPPEMAARIDTFLRAQEPRLATVPRELQAGKPDAREPKRFDSYTAFVFDPALQSDQPDDVRKLQASWDDYLRKAVAKTPALVSSTISERIGSESRNAALLAIFVSLACIIVYLWFRFANVTYGLGAVVALIHDVCIALGAVIFFSWLGRDIPFIGEMKIDLPMIGAFLTLVGYSTNDTIVVFDRIRENRGKFGELSETVVNNSINQTLSRTILTSFTVFIVVVILYIFGGVRSTVHGLSFVMTIGVLVGTYSSVAIAAPIVLYLRHGRRGQKPVMSGRPLQPRPVAPPPVQQ
jgi:preprotein translocase SecF subunit